MKTYNEADKLYVERVITTRRYIYYDKRIDTALEIEQLEEWDDEMKCYYYIIGTLKYNIIKNDVIVETSKDLPSLVKKYF